MAQVTRDTIARIDKYLDYLLQEWSSLPKVADKWKHWEPAERLSFILEWDVSTDRLGTVEHYIKQHQLMSAQRAKYEKLLGIIEKNRSILDRLLSEKL